MSDPREHLDHIRRQFTRQADAYSDMPQTSDAARAEALASFTGVQPHHEVFDVACGPGFLTAALARRSARALGVDATPALIERARNHAAQSGITNLRFQLGDAEALPFAAERFDVVTCKAAFHHFPRPERVLREIRRVVRNDGRVMVADMLGSEDAPQAEYQDRIERLCDPTHVRALPRSEFERLFASIGFGVVAAPSGTMDYDVDEWMAHGGPPASAAAEIVRLFEASLDEDRSGLAVRREGGKLRFSHRVVSFLLQPARAAHPSHS
jgi:ubiquinone/menaquinone biosynthesis C-methylase UbiE